ncbi:hypothetical protein ZIOFF_059830 [Zingiber officinale]|uniref:Uncharacterized protein n=1 Tax=Zingiber officinale TaxID=94328 RepID=A0A8J5FAH0_ZINOF|nr:hypothetical protein ZIOFF_059830 [Zingiber officinale]
MAPEMQTWSFPDGNVASIVEDRQIGSRQDMKRRLKEHSSLIQRLILDTEMERDLAWDLISKQGTEYVMMPYGFDLLNSVPCFGCQGHQGCVNAIAWNAKGSLLISGSDDTRVANAMEIKELKHILLLTLSLSNLINIWSYNDRGLLHSIETGHNANIFCTKFVPETSDELVVSGAGDAEVRIFSLSHSSSRSAEAPLEPLASYKCHTRRVKKLAVEPGNPNVIWSASEDGTLRQHDLREVSSCPSGSSNHECHNVLLDLRRGSKKSLADPPKYCLPLKSCDISPTHPHQLLVGGSDAFARLYDRRMLSSLSSSQMKMKPPPCVNYFCPLHLSEHVRTYATC